MQIVYSRCCGLEVHKKTVVACILMLEGGPRQRHLQVFGTVVPELQRWRDGRRQYRVMNVAMESTGVYCKPVWNQLEGHFELLLANPRHRRAVPGRKTDRKDCEWIAQLLQHGLLRGSFVPPRQIRELRDLTPSRTRLTEQRRRIANRIPKVLEDANVKLASVLSDVLGRSGRAILQALVNGEQDVGKLAALAQGRWRKKIPELQGALQGRLCQHHRFQLERLLAQLRLLEEEIAIGDRRIQEPTAQQQKVLHRWDSIPGIDRVAAVAVMAEMGEDMKQFGSDRPMASWARLCPGNQESAGKRYSGKTGRGHPWLRRRLCQAAWAAAHTKGTYLAARFRRLATRRGSKRAILAVAHTILRIADVLQQRDCQFQDWGAHYFDSLHPERLTRYHLKRLQQLGYHVQLVPITPTA